MKPLPSQEPAKAQQRKDDHIQLGLAQQGHRDWNPFDEIRFLHHSFSNLRLDQVDLSTQWAGHHHRLPFYINGMTGGSDQAKTINSRLAQVAKEAGLAMGVGSLSAALHDPLVRETYTIIRQMNPHGFILANLGAHHSWQNAQKAIDLIQADAIQIHLNTPQEIAMPEGDRDFETWKENIAEMVTQLSVPVIVKEVGFGMTADTLQTLLDLGVQTVDISGRGGTNFIAIENQRGGRLDLASLQHWGQTTPESLLESLPLQDRLEILASGGIRNFYDLVKALALGARAGGLAGFFLKSVLEDGVAATLDRVEEWQEAIQLLMLLLGCRNLKDLRETDLVLTGSLRDWAQDRQVSLVNLAHRSRQK
ncbi:type 2 isopentenyl-diphosphate Delta-isomerase [Facklamia languida]